MRACVIHGKEDLRIEDVAAPSVAERQVRVRIRAGGICGSDIHYFFEGRNGDFVIKEPLIPGHEVSGEVAEVGSAVRRVRPGDRIAVHPGRPCGRCAQCRRGAENLCTNVFFFGSASKFPHMQGAFCESVTVDESQCHPVPANLDFPVLAFAEPLSVALHAITRAGSLVGRRVLVTGMGPIGMLTLMAARKAGASFLAATDAVDEPLRKAEQVGADLAVNVAQDRSRLAAALQGPGAVDVAIEASGSPMALRDCLELVRPGGIVVQMGTLPRGDVAIPANLVMAKELDLRGVFRSGMEFDMAVDWLANGRLDVRPVLTGVYPLADARSAFDAAKDRRRSLKVMIEI
ncbi:MAG: L-idonate 5-dehydrogenase [Alphaproteobacteria bacterium]|nr:L-idonate 5-dehydrogenase [Alphaproteobacteria bacterium]